MSTAILALTLLCVGADPAETAKTPETMLYVRTTPSGAEVRLDGKRLGNSDGLFAIQPGDYKIVVDLAGYQPEEQQITVRDGRITRIELKLRSSAKAAESPKGQSATTATKSAPNVVEGVGWGSFRVGATREELVKAYGPPDPNPGNPWVRWGSRYHVDCLFDNRGGASEVRFNEGFKLPLTSGIRIGSSESEVLTAYGKPSHVVNKPQAKMLEYGSRGVLMWVMNGKVFDFTVHKPHNTAPQPAPNVVEGVGWGDFRVGATREELVKAYGPPDPNPGNPWVRWVSRYHVDCFFDQHGGACEVRFNEGFKLPLTSGIRIGSSESEVLTAYGKPSRIVNNPQAKMLEYGSRGVLMWVISGKVSDFTVFKPHNTDPQPTAQPSGGSGSPSVEAAPNIVEGVGWEAFRLGATREDLVKAFGPPDPGSDGRWVRWMSQRHIHCLVDERRGAIELRFDEGFPQRLATGIGIGSSEKEVVSAYGKPERVVESGQAKKFEYCSRGVLVWLNSDRVARITVFKPYTADAQPAGQSSSESVGPAQAVPEGQNILKNSGIEAGDKTPDAWQQGAAIEGVKYAWDRQAAFEGKASLSIEKTARRYFPIAQWSQTVERQGDQPALLVSAQVKAKDMTKAILDVVFLDANGEWLSHKWVAYIGIQKDGDPAADHDWKLYSGKVEIPPQTKRLSIGLQVYGPGKVWFDDVRAGYTK